MHFLERYATSCGVKIGEPQIYENYFPLSVEKYITIHPASKFESKSYDFWQEVVDILLPILSKQGISIVQIGTAKDPILEGCYHTAGQTNINQVAYILNRAILHLGVDSFPAHIASGYKKKIVCLYSNTFAEVVKPYWGNPEDHSLFEPERNGAKPSFSAKEIPKTINTIHPEKIAEAVCKQLSLEFDYLYKTVSFGGRYGLNRLFESVPNQVVNTHQIGVDGVIVRMDFLFDEQILANQLLISKCSIVTSKPINLEILRRLKPNVREVVYFLDKNHEPEFVKGLSKLGIPFVLITDSSDEEIEKMKVYYMDYGLIVKKPKQEFKITTDNLFYRSAKLLLSDGKIYPSKAAWKANLPIENFDVQTLPAINSEDFIEELDFFYLLTKN